MGCCNSKDESDIEARKEKDRSRELDATMGKEHNEDKQVNKLLLLGAGESGKSTLFKQMIRFLMSANVTSYVGFQHLRKGFH